MNFGAEYRPIVRQLIKEAGGVAVVAEKMGRSAIYVNNVKTGASKLTVKFFLELHLALEKKLSGDELYFLFVKHFKINKCKGKLAA